MSRWDYGYYPPSRPRQAKGGIRAQSKGGSFAESWWAKRWIQVLEGFDIGSRLARGRSYARRGQVLSIGIEKGKIIARVQGSQRRPYEIAIVVKELSKNHWKKLGKALSQRPFFIAKLIAGEMPENIEEVFKEINLALFPEKLGDLQTKCSCPDWSNPCKHVAAVYYLLGEEFDRDPFLIFKLRGIERAEFMDLISGTSQRVSSQNKMVSFPNKEKQPPQMSSVLEESQEKESLPLAEPCPTDPAAFWGTSDVKKENSYGVVSIPSISAVLPKRLGKFPFWRGEENFLTAMEVVYQSASPVGLEVFMGQKFSAGMLTQEDSK